MSWLVSHTTKVQMLMKALSDILFSWIRFSVTKRSDAHQADFYILVDGARYAYHEINTGGEGDEPGSDIPTGSFKTNIQLTAGQVVQIQNDNSATVFGTESGYINSWFTGHMLYAL